ncbi:DUF4199 domain-containing protein [Emticicia sp. BO119]|uniref:DUF4199 domain-containing protein n=1 Tax=Emticicia sp. BO119 TaxID=2757768 RepID=UPI0015F05852|nr:DUF4199 domain-containing protein [Emticicia sp. BO119]MBA4850033.1 DUF4199 domain-containing protein [Emticicia sp. BO119]
MLKNRIVKHSLYYGSIAALICIIVALIQFYGIHKSPFGRYKLPAFGINVLFILIAIWTYRATNRGILTFTEGFSVGFLTNLFAAFITATFYYIFLKFAGDEAILLWVKENVEAIMKIKDSHIKNFGLEDFSSLLKQAKQVPTAGYVFLDELGKKQLCIIAASIISLIFRRHTYTVS